MSRHDILIGIDAGTSVIKAVAFDLQGEQLASSAVPNRYTSGENGAVTQSLTETWDDCVKALRGLGDKVDDLAGRTAGLAVTAQGDGTWLVGKDDEPITDAWIWLDARAAPTVERLQQTSADRARFEATGTGLNTCQQGSQLAHMAATSPEYLQNAQVALHCKDWLYLKLTGVRATDPSEASFTFGNFRTRTYDDGVIDALGLTNHRHLLPPIIDGSQVTHPLSSGAAEQTGLLQGTPVTLGYVDMAMTAFGAGAYTGDVGAACSIIGSTGVHLRAVEASDVVLNAQGTGYVIPLPVGDIVTQAQTNMAATLNIDWVLGLAGELMADAGKELSHSELVGRIEGWLAVSTPGALLYHPYISEAGERGPFVNARARAGFIGLSMQHGYADMVRAVVEGLAMAMRDCYAAMGDMPKELRLTGGAARSKALRSVLGSAIGADVRVSAREEAGAAGAAMMSAVAIGAYGDMQACIDQWVTPLLGAAETPDNALSETYTQLYAAYRDARAALPPVWDQLETLEGNIHGR